MAANPNNSWVIRRQGQLNDYWSNELGWAAYDECTHFTVQETNDLDLPMGGYWSKTHRKVDER